MGLIYKCKLFYRKQRQRFYGVNSICRKIVPADELGEKIENIYPAGNVSVYFPPIYKIAPENTIDCYLPEMNLMKYKNAFVYPNSDMIVLEKGVVWHKYYSPFYSVMNPQDRELYKEKEGVLYMKEPTKIVYIDKGFSLCGVFNYVWSHYIVLYLPKLYWLIESSNEVKNNISIIIPKITDLHIKETIQICQENNPYFKIIELDSQEVAKCETLYHINHTILFNDITIITPSSVVIPPIVFNTLKKHLLNMVQINKEDNRSIKLYIERTGVRNIVNRREIEAFFLKEGFTFISPHLLTLEDKIRLFSCASVIVGPVSSGFSNMMFSSKGTKVLMFTNIQRSFEAFLGFIASHAEINAMFITGSDKTINDLNGSYYISLEKIKEACKEFHIC